MKVKCVPSDKNGEIRMMEVQVDKGIQPYVEIVNNTDGIYTIGCCEGHSYPHEHVLYDKKKTVGWLQLYKMKKDRNDMDKLYKLLNDIDDTFRDSDSYNNKTLVCVIDPFSGIRPMDYCKVFMSKFMWEYFWHSDNYTLMGIDEVVILNDDGSVVGVYKNIYQSALLKAKIIMRDEPNLIMQL